jgi:ABC-type dipeptide/oligopeptide/nickel transport system permease subunit
MTREKKMVDASEKAAPPDVGDVLAQGPPHYSQAKHIVRVFFRRRLAVVGLAILVLLIIAAIFAPLLAPYDPYEMNILNKLKPPSPEHLLGTDSLGRDTLSRIIYGSQTSLIVGIGAIGMATVVGLSLGLIAGFFGGTAFQIIMRFMDCLMSIPMIVLALIIASLLGGGIKNVIIALGIGMLSAPCRMMCGVTMSLKQNEYMVAVRSIGASNTRMMVQHILPNAFPPLVVVITIGLGATILAEAGLSFLGIGIIPPTPAWGGMVNDGYKFLMTSPILAISPGVAIMLAVFGFNMVGDGLRDALDPRLRGTI